jgi:hypothetical protein
MRKPELTRLCCRMIDSLAVLGERTAGHATQRAAWEALRSSDSRRYEARLRGNGR